MLRYGFDKKMPVIWYLPVYGEYMWEKSNKWVYKWRFRLSHFQWLISDFLAYSRISGIFLKKSFSISLSKTF